LNDTYAQKKGIILGNIKDKNTQELAVGASVVIEGSNLGTTTDENGNYKLEIPVGTYNLKVSYIGYASQTKYNIIVGSGNAQTVNFELDREGNRLNEFVVVFNKNKSAQAAVLVTPMSTQKLITEEI